MRLIIQRVLNAAVHVDNICVASIQKGFMVLVGFGQEDTASLPQDLLWQNMLDKMLHLRVFPGKTPDKAHKFHCTLEEAEGEILLVPQFTLYADCKSGRRPGFQLAAPPHIASTLFSTWVQSVDARMPSQVQCGVFGAHMDVSLTNWGPVTIILDSKELFPLAY